MAHIRIPPHIAAAALKHLKEGGDPNRLFAFNVRYPKGFLPKRKVFRKDRVLTAEPISIGAAVISAIGATTGVTIAAGAATYIGSGVILAGAIAANYFLAPQPTGTGPVRDRQPLDNPEIRLNRRQAIPSKRVIYGSALVGGDLFFEEAKTPHLYHGWMIASHKIAGFREVRIGTDVMAFNTTQYYIPDDQQLVPLGHLKGGNIKDSPDYNNNLKVSLRLGRTNQDRDLLLNADFANIEAQYRQRGIATAVMRYKWPGSTFDDRQEMWGDGQHPNPLFLVDGRLVYDPRKPSHVIDNEDTWEWTNNAALIQADYLRQEYGGRVVHEDIDWTEVGDAADYDDGLVACLDGTFIKRHTIDGVITLNQQPSEILTGLLTANRGFVCERAGRVWVSSSRPRDPVLTIHDGLLTGGVEYQAEKPKRDLLNRVRSRFIAFEREYEQADGPVLDRPDLQAADEEILSATISLPFTFDYRRVERLQKQYLESSRLGKTLSVRVSLDVLAEANEELLNRPVIFDSVLFEVANGIYRVHTMAFTDDFSSVELQLFEYNQSIETDWSPAVDEKPFVINKPDTT